MKKLLLLSIIIIKFGSIFAQVETPIDTTFFVKESKTKLLELNEKLYANPTPLEYNWDNYQVFTGESIDCDLKKFKFILIAFMKDGETGAGVVIYKVTKENEIIKVMDRSFGTTDPSEEYKSIIEGDESRWGCYV